MTSHGPPRVLVIYAHPDPQASIANRDMLRAIADLPHVTVHDLYAAYPDFFIDVSRERALVQQHDVIVFQHPLYMYSCPALLKEWMDVILTKGFAHGEGEQTLGKYWRSVVTTGGAAEAYTPDGYNRSSIDDILRPFELCAALCRMEWIPPLVLHWARRVPVAERDEHARLYRAWLNDPLAMLREVRDGQ
ncbi:MULTISPECIES: glutathione-regulated potassium-efflux system ancillary protein KefG [Photobacterium]|uniref:Glutathione-regulated potassium-efflux system ancillary protein KefG n=1 Tax=Photobacterium ganghwense TaxID=320778 RepID=A0A0J1H199_9GAMM|nr:MULTISPECIES: glutathione-regulated potassium-efflux system ancillary protein KefG [Photobacterium]KLV05613.1 potassium transporter KefG [Photobacterium ganghwense]MBV1839932.1 glutathione-regulated potassium-efflux system ancillary protein KefG [Photobacterium ganghwense]PSU06147.1 glutathione-regulated potassium-efflux system ancillary protein KefG [Photobacterium ganghwense]QSV14320.1 glutathione-regulated potassium-efflux system ancillary protein KefG [Photobacterium ganghwense]